MALLILSTLLSAALLITPQNVPRAIVEGHVISDSNLPLPNVTVARSWYSWGGSKQGNTTTNPDGYFTIQTDSPFDLHSGKVVLRFSLQGYRPKTRVVRLNSANFAITLVKVDESPPTVPSCGPTQSRLRGAIGYDLPTTANTKHYSGDALTRVIYFGKFKMGHSWGLNWSYGFPTWPGFYEKAAQMSERDLLFGTSIGAEYRGTHPDGTYFRWIGTVFESMEYDNIPKDAAVYFDSIMDTVCSTR